MITSQDATAKIGSSRELRHSPPVSIVIPTYKRGEVLCQTIEMALAQDYPDFEVIVVDQTPNPSESVLECVAAAGRRLRYVRRDVPNLPAARNTGVRIARGEIIIFIDDDVIISPSYVASHVARYTDPALGGVTGMTLSPSPAENDEAQMLGLRLGASGIKERLDDGCFSTYSIEGCNCSFRKEAIIRAGMFDERFTGSAWGEDTDLALRVKHRGYLLVLDPKIRLVHLALNSGGCENRDTQHERVASEHHRLFLYHVIKNRAIFGTARTIAILWGAYRACALNRESLGSPQTFFTGHWRFLCDLSKAAWAVLHGPVNSQRIAARTEATLPGGE
jgi:GT2 family glycosyltransferase